MTIYIFDSVRSAFNATDGNNNVTCDSGYYSDIDFTLDDTSQIFTNPVLSTYEDGGYLLQYTWSDDFATGFQDFATAVEGYSCNAAISINQNYHSPITIDGEFVGYETGSIEFTEGVRYIGSSWPTKFIVYIKGNSSGSDIAVCGKEYMYDWPGTDVTSARFTYSGDYFGNVDIPSGPLTINAHPHNTYIGIVDDPYFSPVSTNQILFELAFLIPDSAVTITTRSTPYGQTSIKKIYFRDSANAIVFYEYLGQEYTQALRRGEGMMWHGLGSGYINKAIVHDHFAWVYIDGQKYLCKSLGQDLSVY